MKNILFLMIASIFLFSCDGDEPGDSEVNRYYSDYLKIFKSYKQDGNAEATLASLEKYIEDFPEVPRGYALKAYVLAMEGEVEASNELYAKVIEMDPKNAEHYSYWSVFLTIDEDTRQQGYELAKKGLEVDSTYAMLYNTLAWHALFKENYNESLDLLKTGVALDSSSYFLARTTGLTYFLMDSFELSQKQFEEAMSLGWKDTVVLSAFKKNETSLDDLFKSL
jgi:Tfp pilus assembly protein PilF